MLTDCYSKAAIYANALVHNTKDAPVIIVLAYKVRPNIAELAIRNAINNIGASDLVDSASVYLEQKDKTSKIAIEAAENMVKLLEGMSSTVYKESEYPWPGALLSVYGHSNKSLAKAILDVNDGVVPIKLLANCISLDATIYLARVDELWPFRIVANKTASIIRFSDELALDTNGNIVIDENDVYDDEDLVHIKGVLWENDTYSHMDHLYYGSSLTSAISLLESI